MKKIVSLVLIGCLLVSLTACGGGATESKAAGSAVSAEESTAAEPGKAGTETEAAGSEKEPAQEDGAESPAESSTLEEVDNEAFDTLEAMGNIETVNGFLTVSITIPAEIAGTEVTQEALDQGAGERYVSAKLNEDGSVTYKLTKKQHKAMMEGIVASMEESLQGMIDSADYSFTKITHNDDYSLFDVSVSGEELGLADSFAVLAFYMYGGLYGVFTGKTPEKVVVNFYNPNGDLIHTADSGKVGS